MPRMGRTAMAPTNQSIHVHQRKSLMNMSFYWGSYGTVVFSHFPGFRTDMYYVALVGTFITAFFVEWLCHCQLIKPNTNNVVAGLIQTLMVTIRVSLAYVLMLALMSFNGGIFLIAVAGHALGFFLFGSRAFKKSASPEKSIDLPPMHC
ncbi:hypothetical protein K2173_017125 [Erythroxylum novogranatense]|uniref:Copper transport protein n=1 Tax=Erythroxylum novogranatense TaxID=1862640 RepID=A0AAV8U937_9ROSI|nr:hypothetical protein K2173_017125 [Erythroxylum novogranatense]